MTEPDLTLLEQTNSPEQLRQLDESQLPELATQLRQFIIQSVAKTGGHLASGLGSIELTIALHYVFNTPDDRLVWDVGHQTYPHKILTGRREQMDSIRLKDGLSGFPKRDESHYDTFGTGHSSTSISAALGMAIAAKQNNSSRQAVAIIGDGGMTGGMAFEALHHAGDLDANILVILNDNEMSISPNVGALPKYFARALSGKIYTTMREGSKRMLKRVPPMWELARRAEEHVKGMIVPGTIFEELGFNAFGPVDGHSLPDLIRTLKNIQALPGPRLLHVVTRKGHGFKPAEDDPIKYHGVTAFDPVTGAFAAQVKKTSSKTYTQIFGDWLCDMANKDDKLVGITPAMREGSGMVAFSEQFPERYFDVGIAEQHALTVAAGMACDGIHPVVAIYSTFLQRAYDQFIHDIAIQNLPVLFAIDRAGLVGPDGPTHAGSFDLSFMRCIPNLIIMVPSDENECRQLLTTGFQHQGPAAVRYPRGTGTGVHVEKKMQALPLGKGLIKRQGKGTAILAFGVVLAEALKAAEQINATVVDMRFVKPLDEALIISLAETHERLVTIEDNSLLGGAGSAVNECAHQHQINIHILNLGLPDTFQNHASREQLLAEAGLDANGILASIQAAENSNFANSGSVV